jgi:NAD(P)-dependent dehydrogenase (short-subunit alcohol dehydrogenase family)
MGKVILITGVSTGFGKEASALLAAAGHTVYGTVRKGGSSGDGVTILKMDLMDHASIKTTVKSIVAKEGRIDVLINNAGMHTGGPLETSPLENIKIQLDTNILGTVVLTREVLPVMRRNGGGTIINFSSIGGLMGLPMQGYYSTAKFAIEGFSEALRMEVKQFNIQVVLINPGDFHTNNTANRRNYLAATGPDDPYKDSYEKTLAQIEKDETSGQPPVMLAKKLVSIVNCRNPRQRYIISTFEQKLAVFLKYVIPGKWFTAIIADHYKI